jgi:hypothetical protein
MQPANIKAAQMIAASVLLLTGDQTDEGACVLRLRELSPAGAQLGRPR